jgi:hypothetical protein
MTTRIAIRTGLTATMAIPPDRFPLLTKKRRPDRAAVLIRALI